MATESITQFPALPAGQVASDDLLPIVDVSDLASPGGTTKNVLWSSLYQAANQHNAIYNVTDPAYGAVANGATNDTPAFLLAANALDTGPIPGGGLFFPGTANTYYALGTAFVLPKRASGNNFTRWYALRGDGRGAPTLAAITGLANLPIIDASGVSSSVYNFYREITDLNLGGASIAQVGIDMRYNQHFKLENLFINGLVNGSGTAFGVRSYGAICSQFRDIKVHNGQGHGIGTDDDSANFFNANLIQGCSFLALTGDGFHGGGGVSGCSFTGNTFESCQYGMYFSGYSSGASWVGGNYFEQNKFADLYLGAVTLMGALTVEANYLNGYTSATADATYSPVKIKFANACNILRNQVAQIADGKPASGYYFLDANISGGSITDTTVANNRVIGLSSTTPPNQVYNLPGSWANNRNSVIDPVFAPFIQSNINRLNLLDGWTITLTGSSAAVLSASPIYGNAATRMTKNAGACQISTTFVPTAEMVNRFVTVSVPVRARISSKNISVIITPNGTSPQATTINTSTLANGDTTIISALAFVPSNATTLDVTVILTDDLGDFDVGGPCLYVGATPWYAPPQVTYQTGTWTPAPTNLTVVGTPTYTGTYTKIGRRVFCELHVVSTTTTASTANSTAFSGLPYPVTRPSVNMACSIAGQSFGNCVTFTDNNVYTPTWAANANVYVTFSYDTTS